MTTATPTERKPKTFVADFRPVGSLKRQQIFTLGFDDAHARRSIAAQLDKKYGTGKYELSEPVEIADKDLPMNEGLYASLARQREALCPKPKPEARGSIWLFYSDKGHRCWVHCVEGLEAARAIAEARLPQPPEGEPAPTLKPQHRRMTTDEAQAALGGHITLFSVLPEGDSLELVNELRRDYRDKLIQHYEKAIQQLRDSDGQKTPAPTSPPRAPRLLVEGEAYFAGQQQQDVGAGIKTEPEPVGV